LAFHRKVLYTIFMKAHAKKWLTVTGTVAIGLSIAAAGIYVGDTDDAPGAALGGIVLMIGLVIVAVRTARRKA
jgi:hypothetical protein